MSKATGVLIPLWSGRDGRGAEEAVFLQQEFRVRLEQVEHTFARLVEDLERVSPEDLRQMVRNRAELQAPWERCNKSAGGLREAGRTRLLAKLVLMAVESALEMTIGDYVSGLPKHVLVEGARVGSLPVQLMNFVGADVVSFQREQAMEQKRRLIGHLITERCHAVNMLRREYADRLGALATQEQETLRNDTEDLLA